MTDIPQRTATSAHREHLRALATALTERGFDTRLGSSKTGVPLIHVTNPEAPPLAETVAYAAEADGSLWFFWPWGGRIAEAADTDKAAAEVTRVLGLKR